MKCGVENFVLISVYSCFYVVIKIIFFFQDMHEQWELSKTFIISNFAMKYIFVEQLFVLINLA